MVAGEGVHCLADAHSLPFRNDTFALVMTEETLEHAANPRAAMAEFYRVAKPGGVLYYQSSFIIGYHPGPTDFWRFIREGICELIEQAGFHCDDVSIAVARGAGFTASQPNSVRVWCQPQRHAFTV
jgi:SAM-dependent methyltransferase